MYSTGMKFRSIAWMGAGLLLAGVAGAAVVYRRKGEKDMPPEPVASPEYTELREIMKLSAAYNDDLYARLQELEQTQAPADRPAVLDKLIRQNQSDRALIDARRETLQEKLAGQGRTFADVEGFVNLISEYRAVTLEQQKRHLELFQLVRNMENVSDSPELHAYIKLGFKDDAQRYADTDMQLMKAADSQRELMLRAGRILSAIDNADAAGASLAELNELGERYLEISQRIRLYREDDPAGAETAVRELRSIYDGLLPMLRAQAARLDAAAYYEDSALREVVRRMLPLK